MKQSGFLNLGGQVLTTTDEHCIILPLSQEFEFKHQNLGIGI